MTAKKASDLIEAALTEAIEIDEDSEEGDILLDWVLVAYVANPDREKLSAYPIFLSNGEMPLYRAKGLLILAIENLQDE